MKLIINNHAKERLKSESFPDVVSVKQVQKILGIGRVSVYNLIESGKISAFRLGSTYKIPKKAVAQFLENNQVGEGNDGESTDQK